MLWTSLSIALKGNHYLKAFSHRTLHTSSPGCAYVRTLCLMNDRTIEIHLRTLCRLAEESLVALMLQTKQLVTTESQVALNLEHKLMVEEFLVLFLVIFCLTSLKYHNKNRNF